MNKFLLSVGAGLTVGLLYTASPLLMWVLAAILALLWTGGRGLPAAERRALVAILGAALAVRLGVIAVLFVAGLPTHTDLSVGNLAGDDAYYLGRALRARDLLVGFANGRYDYFVVTDEYGRTSYLSLLTWIQVALGPTPYSMRALNAVFFVGGATLLFRTARQAFGSVTAFAGLVVLLFMPSLIFSSVSMLKESLYFLLTSILLFACYHAWHARSARARALGVVAVAAAVWLLDDLRRGALILTVAGLSVAVAIRLIAAKPWRVAATVAIVVGLAGVGLTRPDLRARAVDGVVTAAKMHGGHVFTVGHAYKLLDEGFYMNPSAPSAWNLTLTEPQAARFVVRAAISFLVTPWPWEMASLSELVYLPEHLMWYLCLAFLPAGLVAGWRRDPWLTSLLIGYALPTAAVLALTNGNVGTLLRMRGLVMPYMLWLSVAGALAVANALVASRRPTAPSLTALVPERPTA